MQKSKKYAYEPMAHKAEAYPSFINMKRQEIFVLFPGWDASSLQCYSPHQH